MGRHEMMRDLIAGTPASALAATFDHHDRAYDDGTPLPGPWIWLYFLPRAPMSEVGPDGHPKRGGFLPPVDLPRRMWAGSRMTFHRPIRIGDIAERRSTILRVEEKFGRSGALVFVTVRHDISVDGQLAIRDEHDIVYLGIPERFTPPPRVDPPPADWSEPIAADPVLLFRYSALTFNGHRIHYDRQYCKDVEHYPGLVVHGPLQASLLFDAATRHNAGREPLNFDFRAVRPFFDFDSISVNGVNATADLTQLFTAIADGGVGMQASITWRPR
ncbi:MULTISPECIES: FAS1-like dehydratase domain-containing protein [unclassified Sphingomonas]|uniref:FAS1-like dehydratase domain-containing protein n=1 Tax=unclassified Sphingomonas TaxID=196159 RepID=UPI001910B501|nr:MULTISPECIES: MaoC family dehydratase N-terminal domain-containing protein [unclassified Sphingomonas]